MSAQWMARKMEKKENPREELQEMPTFQGEMKENQARWTYQTWSKGISVLSGVS